MLRIIFSFCVTIIFSGIVLSQDNVQDKNLVGGVSIADDTLPPHPSAIFDVRSVSKGVLIPEMTIKDRDKISNPANGLLVFVNDTTELAGIWYYNIGAWQQLKFRKAYYPKGSIIMYSSTITGYFNEAGAGVHSSTIGWHICNGNDGTPDLRDMFVVGYDPESDDYSKYGANTDNAKNLYKLGPDSIPTHTHEISSATVSQAFPHPHVLTNKNGGNIYTHTHDFDYIDGREGRAGSDYQRRCKSKKQKEYFFEESGLGLKTMKNPTNISGNITLTFGNSGSANPTPFDNRPAYYTLIFIMRTGPSYTAFKDIVIP